MEGILPSSIYHILAQPSQLVTNTTSLATVLIALLIAILSSVFRSSSDAGIHNLGGFHLINAWSFFSKRNDFLRYTFKKIGTDIFCFRLLQHRVVAMAGEANRKIFFNERSLNLSEGYRILLGGVPRLEDISNDTVDVDVPRDTTEVFKRLLILTRKERINEVLPFLLEDVNNMMNGWGAEGKINPFTEVYDLVFQMTVRMVTCKELSEDREAVSRLAKHYWDLEKSATTVSILLPWFPGSARRAKRQATMALYNMLLSYVNIRRKSSTPSMDAVDIYISQGTSDSDIVQTIMGFIFAGVTNTGINSCWALLHLGANPEWKRKAIDEFRALVHNHTNTTSDPLHKRLSTIPLEAWENELPSVDLIIRETLRLSASATLLRRNIGKDIQAGEATIKRADFLAFPMTDVHLNPDIYSNPTMFDPDRYGPDREEGRKGTHSYVAWGAGRHLCAGMNIAKLEIKFVLAMFIIGYEYELVDGSGNYTKKIPEQDRNDLLKSRPLGDPCYLKYKRIAE